MDPEMTPVDHATLDCLQTIIELLHSKGLVTHEECGEQFRIQREKAMQRNPMGVAVFLIMENFCQRYGEAHKLAEMPPGGSA